MSGIHDAVSLALLSLLTDALITNVAQDDPALAGAIVRGPLQGDPDDPDSLRIYVEILEQDPDTVPDDDADRVVEVEIGGAVTWSRRFMLRARCLLVATQENLDDATSIASTVKDRIEQALLATNLSASSGSEYVARGPQATSFSSHMTQGGGPPDAYDFIINVRFDILTTRTGVYPT